MAPATIDLTLPTRASDSFAATHGDWRDEPKDAGRKPHLRDGVIQSFEFMLKA